MAKRTIGFRQGFTESAWKSLAIKSLRIGWVEGIEKAAEVLPPSMLQSMLVGGLFEDVMPSDYDDLEAAWLEIKNHQWEALCSRNTLHGKGYAQEFFDIRHDACSPDVGGKEVYPILARIKRHTTLPYISPRMNNCVWSWDKINTANPSLPKRQPFHHEWEGMPANILDGHTLEGKWRKTNSCLLSGNYETHLEIGIRVMLEGWEPIRLQFSLDDIVEPRGAVQAKLL